MRAWVSAAARFRKTSLARFSFSSKSSMSAFSASSSSRALTSRRYAKRSSGARCSLRESFQYIERRSSISAKRDSSTLKRSRWCERSREMSSRIALASDRDSSYCASSGSNLAAALRSACACIVNPTAVTSPCERASAAARMWLTISAPFESRLCSLESSSH